MSNSVFSLRGQHSWVWLLSAAVASVWCLGCDEGGSTSTGQPETLDTAGSGNAVATGGGDAGGAGTGGDHTETGGVEAEAGGAGTGGDDTETGGFVPQGGENAEGGAGGQDGGIAPLCAYEDGTPIPYDHTRGQADEYAFDLFMSCDLGGFLEPAVNVDPEGLSEVTVFTGQLTAWLRQEILQCATDEDEYPDVPFLLIPPAESEGLSGDDFDALIDVYMALLDRHDEFPDAFSNKMKREFERRLNDLKEEAVTMDTGFTRRSSSPDCAQGGDDPT